MDITALITAIGTIVLGYFTYNQYTKNKLTDLKIKRFEEEDKRKNKARAAKINTINGSKIFGQMLKMNLKDIVLIII